MTFCFEAEVRKISEQIERFRLEGLKCFLSTSFQSNSVVLLHLLTGIDPQLPIYFINTGYHFPETLEFRDALVKKFSLNLHELRSGVPKVSQVTQNGRLFFVERPNYCCYLNKILPMQPIRKKYNVWISGLRRSQNQHRQELDQVYYETDGSIRYYPILEWSAAMVAAYTQEFDLPRHPLHDQGYLSIGCEPCTRPVLRDGEDSRAGRWQGLRKTECGLHLA